MKILVLGDAILDHYLFGKVNRMSPEDPEIPVVDTQGEEYRLGGCLNTAANLRSLSKSKETITVHSAFSNFTAQLLKDKGIQSCPAIFPGELPSSYELIKTRVFDIDTKKQLIRIDNRLQYHGLDVEVYQAAFTKENFDDCDIIVISDYNKGLISKPIIDHLMDFKGQVFVDTKQKDLLLWSGISNCVVKINDKEFEKSVNWWNVQNLVVTRGDEGAELLSNGDVEQVFPTKPIKKADVVGAGDVFLAGMVVAFAQHGDLYKAVKFANLVAGISVQSQGTTEVSLDE